MSSAQPKPSASTAPRIRSAQEFCRQRLRESRTLTGRWVPITAADIAGQLVKAGYPVTERDVEALLRELAMGGEVVEIDYAAGFRWSGEAA